ncbi:MAG: hypothetical protein DRI61_00780 [Chloroflexi bacterium]|nr:MAG: hypothetical protein DRI61_00780 [Chloroflexota bacterium]
MRVIQELDQWESLIETEEREATFYLEDRAGVIIWLVSEGAAYGLAKEIFEEISRDIRGVIHKELESIKITRKPTLQDVQDIATLITILHEKIPPCEIKDGREKPYVDIGTILNAGWLHRIIYPKDISTWKRPEDIEKFFISRMKEEDRLLLRAIDLSEIYRLFTVRGRER